MSLWPPILPCTVYSEKKFSTRPLNQAASLVSLLQSAMTRGWTMNLQLAKEGEGFNHFATFLGSGHVPATGLGSRRHTTRTLLLAP